MEQQGHRKEEAGGQRGSIALLFSGGLDTTLEAVERLKTHASVHLVTFDNGWCVNVRSARRRVEELRSCLDSDRLLHAMVDTKPLLTTLQEKAATLPQRVKSPLVADLACKIAGLTELVAYACRNQIADISDGSARAQTQIFIQHPEFTSHAEPFLRNYGLNPLPPLLFGATREDKLKAVGELGLQSGPRFLESLHITSQLRHQPFCLRGIITFFFTSPLRHLGIVRRNALSISGATALWDALIPTAIEYLESEYGLIGTVGRGETQGTPSPQS